MRLAIPGAPSATIFVAVLIALLVFPGAAFAQESETAEPAEAVVEDAPPEMAKVRFLHGAQAGGMDLYVGDVLALKGLEFGQVSDYVDVLAGKQSLEAVGTEYGLPEGRDAKGDPSGHTGYADTSAKLKPDSANTVVLIADDAGLNELWVIKDKPKPKAGKSMVRIVGLCSNCGPVDFAVDKAKKPVADFDPVTMLPGSSNTLYGVGWVIDDTMTIVPALDAALTKTRVANSAIGDHRVDVYIDGKKAVKGLPQEQAAPFKNRLSGDYFVQVVEAGAAPADGVLSEGMVRLEPGATSAIVVGHADPIYVASVLDDPAKKAKTSRMRFTHVGSALPPFDLSIDGQPVAEGLAFGESTDYVAKVEGEGDIVLDLPDDGGSYSIGSMNFMAPDASYSGYIAGSPEDGDLTLMIINDPVPKKKKK